MMRTKVLLAGAALAAGLAATAPAPAAGAFLAFTQSSGAGVTLGNPNVRAADVFGFDGLSVVAPGSGLIRDRFVCAAVGRLSYGEPRPVKPGDPSAGHGGDLIDVGCGRAKVTVDPALRSARITGTIRSEVYDVETGEEVGPSTITIDLTWIGRGTIRPVVFQDEFLAAQPFPPSAFLGVFLSAGAGRPANAGGTVTSQTIGAVSGKTSRAAVFEGLDGFAGLGV